MSRTLATLSALALSISPAFADLGHVLEEGHGHVHWDEWALFAGLGGALIGYGMNRLLRRRRRRAA